MGKFQVPEEALQWSRKRPARVMGGDGMHHLECAASTQLPSQLQFGSSARAGAPEPRTRFGRWKLIPRLYTLLYCSELSNF